MSAESTLEPSTRPDRWRLALGAAFLVLAGASVLYLLFVSLPGSRAEAVSDWESRLVATAADREASIERWTRDLLADARTLAQYPTAQYVLSGRTGPPYPFDPEVGTIEHLRDLFTRFVEVHGFHAAALYDTTGALLASSRGDTRHDTVDRGPLIDSGLRGTPRIDLVFEPTALAAVAVPVTGTGADPIGAVVIEIDADAFLYRFLRQRPIPSGTEETVLVAVREGGAVYVSPLRKVDRGPGTLTLPLDSAGLAGVAAVRGASGLGRYLDYAGDPVLAAVEPVEGTPWVLVAKADMAEVLAGYRGDLGRIATAILGLLVGALGVVFGVWRWQRQRLAAAVARERARLAALLDHANDPIVFLDDRGRIVELNRRAEEFYGYSRSELTGRPVRSLHPEEERGRAEEHRTRALEEGTAVASAEHERSDGERIPVEISTRTAEIDGRTRMISIVRDLRDRVAAEEALRKSEERYRTLVGNLPDLIVRFDADLRCRFASPPGDGDAPFPVRAQTGRSYREMGLPESAADRLGRALEEVFRTGEPRELEAGLPDGHAGRTFDWRILPERDGSGAVTSALAIVRETTTQRALEHQLQQSQKMEAVGRLAGGVAHDFNNIITSIQGYAVMALDELGREHTISSDLRQIVQSSERAASLTRQLLAFSRRQIFRPQVVDVAGIVRAMEDMLRRLIPEHIELKVECDEGAPLTIRADPSQIEQVVLNLAVNARDAMPDGGELRIRVGSGGWGDEPAEDEPAEDVNASGAAVSLVVADTGTGMDEATVDRIFEPFFTTKEAGKGTGLGLSTVYGIVEQSGGTVDVESRPGEGTRFTLTFPAVAPDGPAAAGEPPDSAADTPPDAVADPDTRTGTVVLVEDEPGVRQLARRVLEKVGLRVVEAGSGAEALERLAELAEPPRLLVTDMVMPGMDGRDLAGRVREHFADCPVLLMSGYTEDAVIRGQRFDGTTAFIEKPFTPAELQQKVLTQLKRDGTAGT